MELSPTSTEPNVTIVVVPRERFSFTRQSLESIYEHTDVPFKLIYVDGNSPAKVRDYLLEQSKIRGFKLIRTDYYLSPNEARNLGLAEVDTEFLVFADNDVVCAPGWLSKLVECANETGAAVIGPLMCHYEPIHEVIHFAGGDARIWVDKLGNRRLREKIHLQGKRVADVQDKLRRSPTEMVEFHCMFVRRDIFDQIGLLDEALLNTREHIDFCMMVREAGETVYVEPDSLVTYVPGPPLELTDLPFYMLRWSNEWEYLSLKHLQKKWNVIEDGNFQVRYKRRGWRRYSMIFEPLTKHLTFGIGNRFLTRALSKLDNLFLNPYLTSRYAKMYAKRQKPEVVSHGSLSMTASSQR